jgi:hypothetical protein
MEHDVSIRLARRDEQTMLESLQRRASLSNRGDRDALLAHPDAIELPVEQITSGCVFVAEHDGVVAGCAAGCPAPTAVPSWTRSLSNRTCGSTVSDGDLSSMLGKLLG